MILDNIGYVICESAMTSKKTEIIDENFNGTGKAKAVVVLQTADERNRNGRYYCHEDLFPQLTAPRTVELLEAGYLRGEMGHPLETALARQSQIRQDLCCCKYLKLWTEGMNIMAEAVGTNNQYGHEFDADLKEGDKPAFSLRALGTIVQDRARGAMVKDIRVITWDCVIYPSHPGAYTKAVVSESADEAKSLIIESAEGLKNTLSADPLVVPFDKQAVLNYIQQESTNLKFIRDMFDFVYNDIVVNERGTKVSMRDTETGDMLVIPIESYIHNEIANSLFGYDEC